MADLAMAACEKCIFGVIGIKRDLFFTARIPTKEDRKDPKFIRIQCRRFPTYEMHHTDEWCGEFKVR